MKKNNFRLTDSYLAAYILINVFVYGLIGAYIGWLLWEITGALIGIIFSLFFFYEFVQLSTKSPINSMPKLIENLIISISLVIGIILSFILYNRTDLRYPLFFGMFFFVAGLIIGGALGLIVTFLFRTFYSKVIP